MLYHNFLSLLRDVLPKKRFRFAFRYRPCTLHYPAALVPSLASLFLDACHDVLVAERVSQLPVPGMFLVYYDTLRALDCSASFDMAILGSWLADVISMGGSAFPGSFIGIVGVEVLFHSMPVRTRSLSLRMSSSDASRCVHHFTSSPPSSLPHPHLPSAPPATSSAPPASHPPPHHHPPSPPQPQHP